jgi:SAM-dependent methyltransferase
MTSSIFICPVCSSPLEAAAKTYRCINNHTYDLAKEGYVNLLLANQKHSREPGDSKEMMEARKAFLNKGYYKPLARSAASLIIKYRKRSVIISHDKKLTYCARRNLLSNTSIHRTSPGSVTASESLTKPVSVSSAGSLNTTGSENTDSNTNYKNMINMPEQNYLQPLQTRSVFTILDAGCGEGYYTDYISKNRYIDRFSSIYGIDLSKDGIKSASKRNSSVSFAVAGIYNIPVADNSADLILNIFAPFDETEFERVLKNNGKIISVAPGAYHLYELKKHLYDEVYLNDEEFKLSERFRITETVRVKYELHMHNSEDIANLLKMTPYYHKSSPDRIKTFLNGVNELKTTADFLIRVISIA